MCCVCSTAHHWSTFKHIAPDRFQRFADTEKIIQHTINVKMNVVEIAARGSYVRVLPIEDLNLDSWNKLALSRAFAVANLIMTDWIMPIGVS